MAAMIPSAICSSFFTAAPSAARPGARARRAAAPPDARRGDRMGRPAGRPRRCRSAWAIRTASALASTRSGGACASASFSASCWASSASAAEWTRTNVVFVRSSTTSSATSRPSAAVAASDATPRSSSSCWIGPPQPPSTIANARSRPVARCLRPGTMAAWPYPAPPLRSHAQPDVSSRQEVDLAEVHDIDALGAHLFEHQTVELRERGRGRPHGARGTRRDRRG